MEFCATIRASLHECVGGVVCGTLLAQRSVQNGISVLGLVWLGVVWFYSLVGG